MKFFRSIKDWFARHIPTKRRLIQIYTALLYNANIKGFVKGEISQSKTKYACVPGLNCYSCPGAVGACPLGALQNSFAQSGTRAAYYVIGILGLFGLIFARTVCGFLCPVGLCQELAHKVPTPKIKKSRFTRVFSYLKYVILAVLVIAVPVLYGLQGVAVPGFCKYICPAGTAEGGLGLLFNPANWSGSRDLLNMLNWIFSWKFALLCAIIMFCVVMYRPFCRFLCPLGAIYGFFNRIAFFGVTVDKLKCTDFGLCVKHCEMDIKHVGDHECIHCGKCIKVCPMQAISWKGSELFSKKEDGKEQPTENEQAAQNAVNAQAVAVGSSSSDTLPAAQMTAEPTAAITVVLPAAQESSDNDSSAGETPPPVKRKRKRGAAFWTQVAAWSLALAVLLGALLYFNVFAQSEEVSDMFIGQECPDFTLQRYGEDDSGSYALLDDTFTLSEQRGSVVVINFWATWCGPCVAELPYFNKVANDYPEVEFVAIHGSSTENVARYIYRATDAEGNSWHDYRLTFLQDKIEGNVCKTFQSLGGNSAWPMTLIVDKDGKITFTKQGSITYDKLKEEVGKALNAE